MIVLPSGSMGWGGVGLLTKVSSVMKETARCMTTSRRSAAVSVSAAAGGGVLIGED